MTEKFLNFQTVAPKLFGLALFQFFSSAAIIYYLQKSIIIIQIKQKSECRDNSKMKKLSFFKFMRNQQLYLMRLLNQQTKHCN